MAREFPNSRFKGYDFSEEGVENGRQEAAEWKLTNATFEVQDVARIPESGGFDFVTAFDAIHDLASFFLKAFFKEFFKVTIFLTITVIVFIET